MPLSASAILDDAPHIGDRKRPCGQELAQCAVLQVFLNLVGNAVGDAVRAQSNHIVAVGMRQQIQQAKIRLEPLAIKFRHALFAGGDMLDQQ